MKITRSNKSGSGLSLDSNVRSEALPQLAKVAIGILAWPIARLSKPDRFKKHIVRKLITDGETTSAIEWEVRPDDRLGMPTMLSVRLLFALCKLASEYKMQTGLRPERFSLPSWNKLCILVGIKPSGGNRKLLQHHLEILHSTLVSSKQAFKTKARSEGISDKFVLVPRVELKGQQDDQQLPNEETYVTLAKPLLDSLDNEYVKTIDLSFMAELENETAQLLYTKLSYVLHGAICRGKDFEDIEYNWIVESMGLTNWKEKFHAKEQLKPAFNALAAAHYIELPEWWIDGSWSIRVRPGVRYLFGEERQLAARKQALLEGTRRGAHKSVVKIEEQPPEDDMQKSTLIRMALRIKTGRRIEVDVKALEEYGLTLEDAERKAAELIAKTVVQ